MKSHTTHISMKKQFFRVMQLADQTFARGEKTEVLTEDLQLAEKRVENIKNACRNTAKNMGGCLISQSVDQANLDKRKKKMPECVLGNCMVDSSNLLGEASVLGLLLSEVGKLETTLGIDMLDWELKVEKDIIVRLQQVEEDVTNIVKSRQKLRNLTLDMDSARARYQGAMQKHASIDSIKDELEDAISRVEICRDTLATEIFNLLAKEPELATLIVQYVRMKKDYHQQELDKLSNQLPILENIIKDSSQRPVFGKSLEEHLESTDRQIAYPIEVCICALYEVGLQEEGLFRIAGGASKVKKLKAAFDANMADLGSVLGGIRDPHVIASCLKCYLRELPDPLLTYELYEEWTSAIKVTDQDARLQALWQVLHKLPETRKSNLKYLVKFFAELARHTDTKMTASNIAIVMAPNLLWSAEEGGVEKCMNMSLASTHNAVVDTLISYADWFFPEDIDFYVTCSRIPPPAANSVVSLSPKLDNGGFAEESPEPQTLWMKTHRRMGSLEGQVDGLMKPAESSGSLSDQNGSHHLESPRPKERRRKPAPAPPSLVGKMPENNNQSKDKDKNKSPKVLVRHDVKETTSDHKSAPQDLFKPDASKSYSTTTLDKPKVTERPRLVTPTSNSATGTLERNKHVLAATRSYGGEKRGTILGFEAIEKELQRAVEARQHEADDKEVTSKPPPAYPPPRLQPFDTIPALSSSIPPFNSAQLSPPVPQERTKVPVPKTEPEHATQIEVERSRPQIPERPPVMPRTSLTSSTNSNSAANSLERRGSLVIEVNQDKPHLEKTHMYSVDKQVAVVQVLTTPPSSTENLSLSADLLERESKAAVTASDILRSHPDADSDILYADVEPGSFPLPTDEVLLRKSSFRASFKDRSSDQVPKPERPPKPERIAVSTISLDKQEVQGNGNNTLPRKPQPPIPPVKPRTGSGSSINPDSTDL